MRRRRDRGQAIILVLVGLSLFFLGALGLAIDGSQLYAQRQMAQNAADAAAQAGVMSLFDKTNTGPNAFGTAPFTCTPSSDARTPCLYARLNGFGVTGSDTVAVDFPASAPGVKLSASDNPALLRVTIIRNVTTGLVRFLGPSASSVAAQGTAAILDVLSPVPIIVTHPTMSGAFQKNGSNTVVICGGPTKSIQVNSSNPTSIVVNGNGPVDLSKAGPKNFVNENDCKGEGTDFGDFGGPKTYPGVLLLGTDGKYTQPTSPIEDPLRDVPPPAIPPAALPPVLIAVGTGLNGCPVAEACMLYSPGLYNGGITIKNQFALFEPGIYYMKGGGFHLLSNSVAQMATGFTDPVTGSGLVVYNTGNNSANDIFEITSNSGQIGGVQYGNSLTGAPGTSDYKGILFFEDRSSPFKNHSLQGGGGLTLRGTIYLNNTDAIMTASPGNYQYLQLQGNAGSTTRVIGMIIVGRLLLGGTSDIIMTLDPNYSLNIRQVALVR